MNYIINTISGTLLVRKLLVGCFLCLTFYVNAQTCFASFNYVALPNGQVNFTSTSTGTVATTIYSWNFGGSPASISGAGSGFTQVSPVFPTSGVYNVTLSITNPAPACFTFVVQTITVVITPTCAISVSTSPATFTNCNAIVSMSTPNMCPPITYTWSNALVGPFQNSLCAGNYTVVATGGTGPGCCPSASVVISVPSVTPCNLSASFTHSIGNGGLVNFVSTSTGTVPGSQYQWIFGDGSPNGFGLNASRTYTTAGPYNAYLVVTNNSITPCIDTSAFQSITPNFCNLSASFTTSTLSNGAINFISTSTGTSPTTQYFWNFGDGTTGSLTPMTHGYVNAGTYTVVLTVTDNVGTFCTAGFTNVIIVNQINCNLVTSFSHTVLNSGVVNFSNTSVGTDTLTKYFWEFGDSYTAIIPSPTHTYSSAGAHLVKFRIEKQTFPSCKDSITQAINITGITCVANSGFTLYPSGTPQLWYATPSYPYNVTSAIWNWGDGASSVGLYASHVYAVAGNYSICLTVTVSCGESSSYCHSYFIAKPSVEPVASGIYSINIVAPSLKVGIENTSLHKNESFELFPNPSNGQITIRLNHPSKNLTIKIFDFTGKEFGSFRAVDVNTGQDLDLNFVNAPSGLYFLSVNNDGSQTVKKIIIRND